MNCYDQQYSGVKEKEPLSSRSVRSQIGNSSARDWRNANVMPVRDSVSGQEYQNQKETVVDARPCMGNMENGDGAARIQAAPLRGRIQPRIRARRPLPDARQQRNLVLDLSSGQSQETIQTKILLFPDVRLTFLTTLWAWPMFLCSGGEKLMI